MYNYMYIRTLVQKRISVRNTAKDIEKIKIRKNESFYIKIFFIFRSAIFANHISSREEYLLYLVIPSKTFFFFRILSNTVILNASKETS